MLAGGVIPIILVVLLDLLLGLVTLVNNPSRYSNRMFANLCLLSSVFASCNYLADHDQGSGLLWSRSTFAAAVLMVLCLVLFLGSFPRPLLKQGRQATLTAIGLVMAAAAYMPAFLPDVIIKVGRTDVQVGPLYPLFLIFLALFITIAGFLIRTSLRNGTLTERIRTRYLVLGISLTSLLILATNVILPMVLGNNDLSALGSYFMLIFIGFSSYAIIRHRLFDIRLLVTRSLTYLMLLVTLATVYTLAAFELGGLFLHDNWSVARQAYNVVLALIMAFTFQSLRRFFERVTNRIFYRYNYDSQVVLNAFSQVLVSEIALEPMLRNALGQLCRDMHIQFGQVVVFNNESVYKIEHFGPLPKRLMIAPELRRLHQPMLLADELPEGELKRLMSDHGIRVSVRLHTRNEFIGYLLLGDKLSGDIYANQDVELLEIVTKELAVAVLNAKAYAEIREFNMTLQQRVDHATNRLRVANRHLKELDKAKDEFISMASHQLRTPLTTIKGYLSMMLEGDVGKVTDDQRQFITYAFTSSERMVNLISDLLNVSRLSAGRFLIQAKPTDLVQVVADEVRQLQSHAIAKGIQLVFEHPGESFPATVELDDNKTRQVIMNFIDNAIYYTTAGNVGVHLERVGEAIRLEVRDTGIGVPEEARRRLFTKFFRAQNAQTVRPDGTGLGLYLAKRVIEDQGGTIIFKSVEGKGSTFGFELPIIAHKPKPSKEKHG